MVRIISLVAVLALLGACGSSMSSVPVRGHDQDLARMAGEWKGEFEGSDRARRGTIKMILETGRHTASAQVTMVGAKADGSSIRLKVEYLKIADGEVVGQIESYDDAACGCKVETKFEGVMSGDFMIGTYLARMTGTDKELSGQWSAERINQ